MNCVGPLCIYSYQDVALGAVFGVLLVVLVGCFVWFERNI
jgi:hypothetical protein